MVLRLMGAENYFSSTDGRLFMSSTEKGMPGMDERMTGTKTTLLSYCKVPSLMSRARQGKLGLDCGLPE